jgi:hypothetical protein
MAEDKHTLFSGWLETPPFEGSDGTVRRLRIYVEMFGLFNVGRIEESIKSSDTGEFGPWEVVLEKEEG